METVSATGWVTLFAVEERPGEVLARSWRRGIVSKGRSAEAQPI